MRRFVVTAPLLAVLFLTREGGATGVVTHPPRIAFATAASTNWSGYAAYNATFSDVKGTWTQPAVNCPTNKKQYASFWVGLDGYNSNSVEQIGTDSDCTGQDKPSYYAWFELYPAPHTRFSLAIHPGDTISAEVASAGSQYTLTLANVTTGDTVTTNQTAAAQNNSAEWIAEAPSFCTPKKCSVLPLADFGTVNFSGSYTTGNGQMGTISTTAWSNDEITMITPPSTIKAQPTSLSPDGGSFSVAWKHN